ncbi:MAG: hypothetical protein JO257_20085 [Deltaproteobacteria bacterium]|nr:hypothetical protein [Deltaproteobacteria bacterium]
MRWPLAILLVAATAFAEDVPRIDVEVGASFEKNVEYARGWMCDDPSLLTAEMVTRDDKNYWVVKGVKVGETMCRIGLDRLRVHYVFDVHVLPKRTR